MDRNAAARVEAIDWNDIRTEVRRYLDRLPGYFDAHTAEDLTAEVIAELYQSCCISDIQNPNALAMTIAFRRRADLIRRIKSRPQQEDFELAERELSTAPNVLIDDLDDCGRLVILVVREVLRAMESGKRRKNAAAVSCSEALDGFLADTPWTELGTELRVPANTVAQRWHRCLEVIRPRIEQHPDRDRFYECAESILDPEEGR